MTHIDLDPLALARAIAEAHALRAAAIRAMFRRLWRRPVAATRGLARA